MAGDDVGNGVSAFVSAVSPSRVAWPIILGAVVVVVAAVAVVGRRYERNARAGRRQAALQKRWDELTRRIDILADPVLEMSTRVDLDGRAELIRRYRTAASDYGDIRDSLDRQPVALTVDDIDRRITELEQSLAAVARSLDPGDEGSG